MDVLNTNKTYNMINYRDLLRTIYLKLYNYGYKEISLKNTDLKVYVPMIEEIFDEYGIYSDDLFVLTPVFEIYDRYKAHLVDLFINNGLGYFNSSFDGIIIDTNNYYVKKQLEEMNMFIELINKCCDVFVNRDLDNNQMRVKRIIREK